MVPSIFARFKRNVDVEGIDEVVAYTAQASQSAIPLVSERGDIRRRLPSDTSWTAGNHRRFSSVGVPGLPMRENSASPKTCGHYVPQRF